MDYLKFKEARRYEDLKHYGIPGQKWGVRRFQNEDGTLTSAGQKKQLRDEDKAVTKQIKKELHKKNKSIAKSLLSPNDLTDNIIRQKRVVSRATKYVKESNMSLDDALHKSRSVGRRNRALLFVGSFVTITAAHVIRGY